MVSLSVQFAKMYTITPDYELAAVNHAMFYISDLANGTIHRVESNPDYDEVYHVRRSLQKHSAPRNKVGEAFHINLTPSTRELTGAKLADMLAKLPPPAVGKGGCQWWILSSVASLERKGQVQPGSFRLLLADERLDSPKLMEFGKIRAKLIGSQSPNAEINLPSDNQLEDFIAKSTVTVGMKGCEQSADGSDLNTFQSEARKELDNEF